MNNHMNAKQFNGNLIIIIFTKYYQFLNKNG